MLIKGKEINMTEKYNCEKEKNLAAGCPPKGPREAIEVGRGVDEH